MREDPDAFLSAVGQTLADQAGNDVQLAEILATWILRALPAEDGVARAKQAIVDLAVMRSSAAVTEVPDE